MKIQHVLLVCGLMLGTSVVAAEQRTDSQAGNAPTVKAGKKLKDGKAPAVKAKKKNTTPSKKRKTTPFKPGKELQS